MKLNRKRALTRDKVVSMTNRGARVGVYYADTDGSNILAELTPQAADKLIAKHNAPLGEPISDKDVIRNEDGDEVEQ